MLPFDKKDGVGVLPWMLCGTNEIGVASAEIIGKTIRALPMKIGFFMEIKPYLGIIYANNISK